jgi:hypothetical protein
VSTNEAPATAKPALSTFGRERPEPGAYRLDLSEVVSFPLTDNGQPSTFADIYRKLRDAKVLKVPQRSATFAVTFDADAGEVTIRGVELFVLTVLRDLLDLHKDGIDPYRAIWFYYGHDVSCDGDALYEFFVVQDGKIVRERVTFIHCDPRVLVRHKADDQPIWRSEPYGHEAWETYWYRKFYTETLTGQLMVLRADEPMLYRYQRAAHDVTRDVQFVTQIKIYGLLWVAVALLAAIAFPILRPYMAVVAAIAMADFLWKLWATRKIGG